MHSLIDLRVSSPSIVLLLLLFGSYVVYSLIQRILTTRRRFLFRKSKGCRPIPRYPQKDPILGLDLFLENLHLLKHGGLLKKLEERYNTINGGVHTWSQKVLGIYMINTIEPENIKTILATNFKEFKLPPMRKEAMRPIFGHGIFTTDGKQWEESRALLRPNFTRSNVGDLDVHEEHISKMIAMIPKDGKTVDLQELFFLLTLDSATDFLFGTSTDILGKGAESATTRGKAFNDAFTYGLMKISIEARIGKLGGIFPDRKAAKCKKYIHDYIGSYVRKTVQHTAAGTAKMNPDRYIFLEHLAHAGYGESKIRDELLNILLAGRDTTAGLLAHLWYVLARRPDVFNKLRAEVLKHGETQPTFESIKEMRYLRYCLNETLRLYPIVPANTRLAIVDTVLPLGGGVDGKSPIFVPAGTPVGYQVYVMQRRKDIFGDDANEFRPERWETFRPSWNYLPFNGGPRICIGQQFALTEASYTTIRLLQTFKAIESHDPSPYEEHLPLTLMVRGGTLVGLTAA